MLRPQSRWGHPLLVALASILPYLGALGNDFVWDDHVLIEDNPALAYPLDAFGELLAIDNLRTPYYRPVAVLWWALLRNGLGLGPGGFHLASILLHAVSAVLVFLVARRLLAPGAALLAGMLFAVHPVHVEAVAFASAGATELLPAALFLAALLPLVPPRVGAGAPCFPSAARVWAAAAIALLAALAKELAALFFVLGIAALAAPRGGAHLTWCRRARLAALLLVSPAIYVALRLWAAGRPDTLPRAVVFAHDPLLFPPWLLKVVSFLAFPAEPLPYHVLRPLGAGGAAILAAALFGAALVLLWLYRARRGDLAFVLAAGLLLLPLAPALPLLPRAGAAFAERFLYLPSAGFCLLAGCAAETVARWLSPGWRRAAAAALAALLALAAVRTFALVGDWRDDATLFTRALARDPDNANLLLVRATHLLAAGAAPAAEQLLLRAEALSPGAGEVRLALARAAQAQGRAEAARRAYRDLLGDARLRARALAALGFLEAQAGEDDLGEREFAEAAWLDPRLVDAHLNLGELAWRRGDRDAARRHWERGLAVAPGDAALLYDLGLEAQSRGDAALAREYYRRALAADPNLGQARRQLDLLAPAR